MTARVVECVQDCVLEHVMDNVVDALMAVRADVPVVLADAVLAVNLDVVLDVLADAVLAVNLDVVLDVLVDVTVVHHVLVDVLMGVLLGVVGVPVPVLADV